MADRMDLQQATIERIIQQALGLRNGQASCPGISSADPSAGGMGGRDLFQVPVGVSNRHVHLSRTNMDALFGPGAVLRRKKAMKQPGQFAAEETVTLRGPKGELARVRVLGPLRAETQVEVSVADGYTLGVVPPLRMSGQLDGTPGVEMVGPHGSVRLEQGLIVAARHIHMLPATATRLGLRNGEEVDVEVAGERGGVMRRVVIRATEASDYEMHIDVEEANAYGLKNDDLVCIRKH